MFTAKLRHLLRPNTIILVMSSRWNFPSFAELGHFNFRADNGLDFFLHKKKNSSLQLKLKIEKSPKSAKELRKKEHIFSIFQLK